MAKEETLRARAVSMYTQGQSVPDIAKALVRSRQWVHKWINRSLSDSADWSQSLSTAPHCSPYKVSLSMEEQVIRATSAAADAFTCGLQSEIYRSRPHHRG